MISDTAGNQQPPVPVKSAGQMRKKTLPGRKNALPENPYLTAMGVAGKRQVDFRISHPSVEILWMMAQEKTKTFFLCQTVLYLRYVVITAGTHTAHRKIIPEPPYTVVEYDRTGFLHDGTPFFRTAHFPLVISDGTNNGSKRKRIMKKGFGTSRKTAVMTIGQIPRNGNQIHPAE